MDFPPLLADAFGTRQPSQAALHIRSRSESFHRVNNEIEQQALSKVYHCGRTPCLFSRNGRQYLGECHPVAQVPSALPHRQGSPDGGRKQLSHREYSPLKSRRPRRPFFIARFGTNRAWQVHIFYSREPMCTRAGGFRAICLSTPTSRSPGQSPLRSVLVLL